MLPNCDNSAAHSQLKIRCPPATLRPMSAPKDPGQQGDQHFAAAPPSDRIDRPQPLSAPALRRLPRGTLWLPSRRRRVLQLPALFAAAEVLAPGRGAGLNVVGDLRAGGQVRRRMTVVGALFVAQRQIGDLAGMNLL